MHENTAIKVTLIEPGMADTDFFDNRPGPRRALDDDDIARAVMYAISQPDGVDINEILITADVAADVVGGARSGVSQPT